MTTISEPKQAWEFFEKMKTGTAVFLNLGMKGIAVSPEMTNLDDPPDVTRTDVIPLSAWRVLLRVMVALRGGRPVKVAYLEGEQVKIWVGPKP